MSVALFTGLLNKMIADAIWFGGGLLIHGVVYFGATVLIGGVWCLQGARRLTGKGQRRGIARGGVQSAGADVATRREPAAGKPVVGPVWN